MFNPYPNAAAYVELFGFPHYLSVCLQALEDGLWSDLHKEVYGFRPHEPQHFPHPDHIDEAYDIMHDNLIARLAYDRAATLMAQRKFWTNIGRTQYISGISCGEAIIAHCNNLDNFPGYERFEGSNVIRTIDAEDLCHTANMPFEIAPMIAMLVSGELA